VPLPGDPAGAIVLFDRTGRKRPRFKKRDARILREMASFLVRALQIYSERGCDPLTGLANRRLLERRCAREMQKLRSRRRPGDRQTWFVVVDLDHFGAHNEASGHLGADRLLQDIAREMKRCLREDDLLARWGGDEFCIILTAVEGSKGAREVLERVRAAIEKITCPNSDRFEQITGSCRVSASIGATRFREGDLSGDDLFRRAERAADEAERKGRNRVEIDPDDVDLAAGSSPRPKKPRKRSSRPRKKSPPKEPTEEAVEPPRGEAPDGEEDSKA
jgi:diguanylate cyclase (GGDEF)-like protein